MRTPDKAGRPAPDPVRPDPTKLSPSFAHLNVLDTRTLEEQRVASLKESA